MIDGLILNAPRTTSPQTTILTPTPIKLQQSILTSNSGMSQATPTMISSTHNSPPSATSTPLNVATNPSPTIEWTHERIMNLIKLYEKKSVLWNPSNPEYFHRDIRNMVYDDLVRELNISDLTVNETKRKLENLRSYFRRETKKLQDHERKTSEKLMSRWPYYESLQFIHEFMSVKNESGAEMGFSKNITRSNAYQLPTMKRESAVQEECAMQVPLGSTSNGLENTLNNVPTSAFHLANSADLVAVLKALQGPLVETAASCFGMTNPNTAQLQNGHINGTIDHMTPYHSPNDTQSPQRDYAVTEELREDSQLNTPLLPQNLAVPAKTESSPKSTCKKRKLVGLQSSVRSIDEMDLCGDYGRTVAHQLRQMESYDRDLCRLQIDQLIFNLIHKEKNEINAAKKASSEPLSPSTESH